MQQRPVFLITLALWGLIASADAAHPTNSAGVSLNPQLKVIEGIQPLSPPALQFDREGRAYIAWFGKKDETTGLFLSRIVGEKSSLPVRVNTPEAAPDTLHQAPGLAVARSGEVYLTWSTSNKDPNAPFATMLRMARSADGQLFGAPVAVNDDNLPINHSFESVKAGPNGDVYVAWLDSRGKDKSGAAAIFARSLDGGKSIEKNVIMDGMACPCCRPMIAHSPDGGLWVAWRKTFDGDVRDIVLGKSEDRGAHFSKPLLVSKDGWAFPACPHRGPSIGFDRMGRLYVAWYTEGTDEQPRMLFSTSDDHGKTFTPPISLSTSSSSLPDQIRMAVHPDGAVVAVWEEVTGVRKRVVMRLSMDRGANFGPVQALSQGSKAETPTVAIHENGAVGISWSEHSWPNNRIMLQQGQLDLEQVKGK